MNDNEVLVEPNEPSEHSPYETKELGKLFEALAKAHSEMQVAKADSRNPFFKSSYAGLCSIVNASRQALSKYGLTVIQRPLPDPKKEDGTILHTRLGHSSGQWMDSIMPLNPPKEDIQALGSYMTYVKRYTYSSIAGVVVGDEEDDGEAAMQQSRQKAAPAKKKPSKISAIQLSVLSKELQDMEELLNKILKGYNISKLSDLPVDVYQECLGGVRKKKNEKPKEKEN